MQQIMTQQCNDKVICLKDESGTTPMQQHVYFCYNKNDVQFPTHLFISTTPECVSREWVERAHDLRYFKMHSSRRKGLIGMRKVGRCIGNLYCPYDECPFKLSADGERNTPNFQNVEGQKSGKKNDRVL